MSSALLIIAHQGFQDHEYADTRAELEAGGFVVTVASTQTGDCIGKFDGHIEATLALHDVDASQFDCIAFIGGPGAAALKSEPEALRIARDAVAAKKVLGAVCIAPTILAAAGVLQGKEATVWDPSASSGQVPKADDPAAFLEKHGAHYTGEEVTVDGLIVTGNGPKAAKTFGEALVTAC